MLRVASGSSHAAGDVLLCVTNEAWVHGRLQWDFRGATKHGTRDEATQVGGGAE